MKLIYHKKDLFFAGTVKKNSTYEWELENNVFPNFGGTESDYSVIETDIIHPELYMEGKEVKIKEKESVKKQKEYINTLNTLKETDEVLPREIEDLYKHLESMKLLELTNIILYNEKSVKEQIEEKEKYRAKLKEFSHKNSQV